MYNLSSEKSEHAKVKIKLARKSNRKLLANCSEALFWQEVS
jgi:hypothetical protein